MATGNAYMTGQRQLESTTQTGAFHCGDKRFWRPAHRIKKLMGRDHELLHLLKGASLLRVVHLLQIGSRTEISFLQARQHDAVDGGRLLGKLHDLLPLRQALSIEHIDRFADVIKTCKEDPSLKNCGFEVLGLAVTAGRGGRVPEHGYFLSKIIATPCPPPTQALISARSAFRRLSSNRDVMAKRRPETPTG